MAWSLETIAEQNKKKGLDSWPKHYAALCHYFEEHGTCNISTTKTYECDLPRMGDDGGIYHYQGNLGSWLSKQRQAKRGTSHANKITTEQIAQLQLLVDEGN